MMYLLLSVAWSNETRNCYCSLALFIICRQEGLESNETHQLLVCADDVTVLSKDTNTINRSKTEEALLEASREVGLEIDRQKAK
jgi:hypothetical protein